MKSMESARRFIYLSRADTPLRRLFDRASGFTMMAMLLGAVFWCIGYAISRFVDRSSEILSVVIDWCGYHPFVPAVTIALMIGACVVADVRCGK